MNFESFSEHRRAKQARDAMATDGITAAGQPPRQP